MSEELKQEAPAPVEAPKPPKQYLLVVDELNMAMLGRLMPGLLFVQVEGLAMENNKTHMLLVNPLPAKPEEPKVQE